MYPVLSSLRRHAASYVYVTEEMLQSDNGEMSVRLSTPSGALDLAEGRWSKAEKSAVMHEVAVYGKTSRLAAISLSLRESDILEKGKLTEALYTLVVGPEVERQTPKGMYRAVRIAVVRGVYRGREGTLERDNHKGALKGANYRQRPKGTVRL